MRIGEYLDVVELEARTGRTFFAGTHVGTDFVTFTHGVKETWSFTLRLPSYAHRVIPLSDSIPAALNHLRKASWGKIDNLVIHVGHLDIAGQQALRRAVVHARRRAAVSGEWVPKVWYTGMTP